MSSTESHQAAHSAFNGRDFAAMEAMFSDDCVYVDHPRGLTMKGAGEFVAWAKGWVETFSDARVDAARYLESGDTSVAIFQGRGLNDGTGGPLPPTGRQMDLAMCEVMRVGADGRFVRGELFYDAMTMMVQLGHAEPPPTS